MDAVGSAVNIAAVVNHRLIVKRFFKSIAQCNYGCTFGFPGFVTKE